MVKRIPNQFDTLWFAKRLAMLRADRGLNQNQMAKKMGVSQQLYSDIEAGKMFPRFDLVLKICVELCVDLRYFDIRNKYDVPPMKKR